MLKGTASALLVLLLFGVAFGVALFRPIASSSASHVPEQAQAHSPQELENLQAEQDRLAQEWGNLQEEQVRLTQEQETLQAEKARLVQEWENLRAEQARLALGWEDLQVEQARLTQELENLQAEQDRLAQEWEYLREEQAHLTQGLEALQAERVRLDGQRARLWEKEANLAEQGQKLQGFRRWSVVAVVVSGLLAVPSVLVLVAMMRQDQRASGKEIERGQDSRPHRRGQVIQHGGLAAVAPASIHGNDGRGKEGVGYSV